MQHLLDLCSVYATNHQLSYNATKSFSLCFKPNRIKIKPPDFALGEKVIPSVDQCKYLGIIISVKNCDADLKRQMRKYYANANTVGAKEIFTLLKRRKKITAKQGIKFHIPLSLLSVGRV